MNKEIELFKELTKEEMKQLFKISSFKQYKKNNILFFEGDKPQQLFLLLDGIVKVYKVDTKGSEIILHFFQAQTLIAETAHMQRITYPATAMCETDCEILEIDYAKFEQNFLRNPNISMKIIYSLSQKIKTLQSVIDSNLTMNTFSRTCKFLYENEHLLSTLSQRKIAAILNITPETLSRNISILKKEKIVTVEKRTIMILQKEYLKQYC